LAYAIILERIQPIVCADGGLVLWLNPLGQLPNFSLNLCAAQLGL
jgi:hypothetical protein